MKFHVLRNATSGKVLANSVGFANNPWTRAVGLLGRAAVSADEGLWIESCSAVHTVGMRAIIDLYFVDRENRVLKIVCGAGPNQLAITCRGSHAVIELGAGTDGTRDVLVGDRLALE